MYLSDTDIRLELSRGNIICDPWVDRNLSNSSIDLRLGNRIYKESIDLICYGAKDCEVVDDSGLIRIHDRGIVSRSSITVCGEITLDPGAFVLAATLERVGSISPSILGQISDKSTLARLGLSTFFGAGYIDPGNALNITLEIKNNGHVPITLRVGQHICQIRFAYLHSPVSALYRGKYLGSTDVVMAK
jgi:dCTP deaminase